MAETTIEWTSYKRPDGSVVPGYTFNAWRGCTKVSDGCKNCYAETLSRRNPGTLGVWGDNGTRVVASESYWKQPLKWNRDAAKTGERRRVFCASLADVFEDRHELIEPRQRLFDLIVRTTHLDWLLLTKRPQNLAAMIPAVWLEDWPPFVWLGTTVENQEQADKRIPELLKSPARVRFLSCEPLLGPVEFSNVTKRSDAVLQLGKKALDGIDWVIVGGESGSNARPMHPGWARSLRDQCQAVGLPFLFKQWGEYGPGSVIVSTGNPVFRQFENKQQWVNKGNTWVNGGVCLDLNGMQLKRGGDFDKASYPVVVTHKLGKNRSGRTLDGVIHDGSPVQ